MFQARKQSDNKTVEQYYNDLHELIQTCADPDAVHDEMLRDRFMIDLHDKGAQCKLNIEEIRNQESFIRS